MSRHSLQPRADRPDVAEAAIGWDRPLATFFFQAFAAADGDGEDRILEWCGTAPGKLPTPEAAIAVAAGYADIPEHLAATLDADRAATAVRSTALGSPASNSGSSASDALLATSIAARRAQR